MTTRKFLALSVASFLLSAPFAMAATSAHRTHHVSPRHHTLASNRHSSRSITRASANGDTSADALNAQSLARARGQ